MIRGKDGRLYERVWTAQGWQLKPIGDVNWHPPCKCGLTVKPPNRAVQTLNGAILKCKECEKVDPEAIKAVMQSMEKRYLIIDEILFVATTKFGITASLRTLRDALRHLWNNGQVKYQKNRFGQDCFALI